MQTHIIHGAAAFPNHQYQIKFSRTQIRSQQYLNKIMPARKSSLISVLLVFTALLLAMPSATALGGWQTICILFRRLNSERAAQTTHDAESIKFSSFAAKSRRRGTTTTTDEAVIVQATNKNNGNHVQAVSTAASSRKVRTAFVPRTTTSCLDEDDLTCISFVGRSPFL